MSTSPTAHRSPEPSVRRTALIAALNAVAIAAIIVLAAVLFGLSQPPGDGRVPHPEPAPAPVPQR